jgi:hypothetical protein
MSPEIVKMLEKNRDENFNARMDLAHLVGELAAHIWLANNDLKYLDLKSPALTRAINQLDKAYQAYETRVLNRSKSDAA